MRDLEWQSWHWVVVGVVFLCAVLAFVVLPIGPKKLTCPCHKSTAKTKVVPGVKEKSKAHCIEAEYGNLGSPGA